MFPRAQWSSTFQRDHYATAWKSDDSDPAVLVPFMDLAWQWQQIRGEVLPLLEEVFERSAFSLGPYVEEFENAFAEWLGCRTS